MPLSGLTVFNPRQGIRRLLLRSIVRGEKTTNLKNVKDICIGLQEEEQVSKLEGEMGHPYCLKPKLCNYGSDLSRYLYHVVPISCFLSVYTVHLQNKMEVCLENNCDFKMGRC